MNNVYDPVKQPTLHLAFEDGDQSLEMFGIETLLHTLRHLDMMAEQTQEHFVAQVCMTYQGEYVNQRGCMLFVLTDAVRRAAIRIEQVPHGLREDVAQMVRELDVMVKEFEVEK